MSLQNRVQLVGNLGQDVTFKTSESGTSMARCSFATHEKYKDDKGQRVERTDWHNIVCFGKRAELLRDHTKKGSRLMLTGNLRTRNYDSTDGQTRYVTEVIVEEIMFLDNK